MNQHSEGDQKSLSTHYFPWMIRLLLAALLFFGSEVLLWTDAAARTAFDWGLLVVGYLAMSALLLEIAVRFRLRNVYGVLVLAGIYGMMNGLILNPQSALIDVPRTLLTRAMGAHAFAGLIALALLFGLLGGLRSRRAVMVALLLALIVGVGWGTWAHWSPVEFLGQAESTLQALLLFGGGSAALIALALLGVRRFGGAPLDLRLKRGGWAYTLAILIALLAAHLLQGDIDIVSLTVIVTLTIFSFLIIWFQQRKKGATLLDGFGAASPSLLPLALLLIAFALGALAGYGLPRGDLTNDPIALITGLFTAYGLVWLPAVSLVLGARAFSRQAQAMRF